MASPPQRRRAARHQQPLADDSASRRGPSAGRKQPITVDGIVETALGIVEREGYAALTMRRVASALGTGPASLYAHVVNKEDLDDLLIGRLCGEIDLPEPDPRTWREQIIGELLGALPITLMPQGMYPGTLGREVGLACEGPARWVRDGQVGYGWIERVFSRGGWPQIRARDKG